MDRGGKVLIPVFALGRVQELCILLDTYWDRMNLKVPIYFTMGLAETVSAILQTQHWCNWCKEAIADKLPSFRADKLQVIYLNIDITLCFFFFAF